MYPLRYISPEKIDNMIREKNKLIGYDGDTNVKNYNSSLRSKIKLGSNVAVTTREE